MGSLDDFYRIQGSGDYPLRKNYVRPFRALRRGRGEELVEESVRRTTVAFYRLPRHHCKEQNAPIDKFQNWDRVVPRI